MPLSQIHEIHVGKYCHDNQADNRTYHATHHLLDDEHANDDDDKTCYVISEVTHISLTKPSQIEPNQALPKGRMSYSFSPIVGLVIIMLFVTNPLICNTYHSPLRG